MRIGYTLIEITNANQLQFRYRLVKVREPLPDDALQPIRLQKWADELWRKRLHGPVFPMRRGKDAFFMVPADTEFAGIDLSYVDVPYVTYHADPTPEYREIHLANAEPQELQLLSKMLERPFSDRLSARKQKFWQDTWTRFFYQIPANAQQPSDRINAFRGITFSVVTVPPKSIYLALDVLTRFVSRLSLADYRAQGHNSELISHCDVPFENRKWMLRDNGSVKSRCIYAGEAGQSIGRFRIEDLGFTVLEYYREKFPAIAERLDPNEPAIYCAKDKTGTDPLPVPGSRLFPVLPFERDFRKQCSISPQLPPHERERAIWAFLNDLGPVRYGSQDLQLSDSLLTANDTYFLLPSLEFGNGLRLDPKDEARPGPPAVSRWGARKIRALMEAGPYFREEFPPIVLLYPKSQDRAALDQFVRAIEEELGRCSAAERVTFSKQFAYTADPNGHDLSLTLSALKGEYNGHALIICILSRRFHEFVHNRFKTECEDLYSQCVREESLLEVTVRHAKRRNFVLGIMMSLGFKPWVLATDLHAEVHVGVDVLGEQVAYTFIYGPSGRHIFRDRAHSGGAGLIKGRLLREKLVAGLTRIHSAGFGIGSLVLHRDGRWWPKETEALDETITFLQATERRVLPRDVRYAAVEIRKSHFPIRIFSTTNNDGKSIFQNPFPGCYLVLDRNRAVLTTTGRPTEWDEDGRTAGTMLVQITRNRGNLRIDDVTRDVFYLTQLNWNAPDIEINAPVTIRWADDLLRELYIEPDY